MNINDKIMVVTGASSGIGAATAKAAARGGCKARSSGSKSSQIGGGG